MSEDIALSTEQIEQVADAHFLARELADYYATAVSFQMRHMKRSLPEAQAAVENPPEHMLKNAMEQPARDTAWFNLKDLETRDPELAWQKWQSIKAEAREDVAGGHYLLNRVIGGRPYEKAIFLAVRSAFKAQWQPQNAGELILVDTLALTYSQFLFWTNRLEVRVNLDGEFENDNVKRNGKWKPSLVTEPAWIETTAVQVERFHRLFLRTLRALRDLRRWNVNVNINNPGQVNIGQQQVNTAKIENSEQDTDD